MCSDERSKDARTGLDDGLTGDLANPAHKASAAVFHLELFLLGWMWHTMDPLRQWDVRFPLPTWLLRHPF